MKNIHLRRYLILPRVEHGAGLLRRTSLYASLLRISGALHLDIFAQPLKFFFVTPLMVLRGKGGFHFSEVVKGEDPGVQAKP